MARLQEEEMYDSLDDIDKPTARSKPAPSPSRPEAPNLALQQEHQGNLAAGAAHQPGFLANLISGAGNALMGKPGAVLPEKDNTYDLPIMKNYPQPDMSQDAMTKIPAFGKAAWKSGVDPLIDLGKTAYDDVTTSPWAEKGYKTFNKAIVEPMQHTMDKSFDPNISAIEATGHSVASVIPGVGPWMSDVLSESVPKAVYGETGKERAEGLGEVAGPLAVGKALHSGYKKAGRMYNDAGQKRLTKAQSRIAYAADIPEETVEAALPYVDKFMKESKGTDLMGRPKSSAIVPSRKRGLEGMDLEQTAETARHAEMDFHGKNIAPVESQLLGTPANAKAILQHAVGELDPIFKKTLKRSSVPPQMGAVAELLMEAKNIGDLLKLRKSINGLTKTMQAESRLTQADFVRSDPRGHFLNNVQKGVRKLIDDTIDVNAGEIGQTAEVLKTYSHMKDFADGLEVAAEKNKATMTAERGKRFGKVQTEAQAGAAAANIGGSKSRVVSGATNLITRGANLPDNLIPSAGKLIERRGNLGLTPSGRSAMFQPPYIKWAPPFGNLNQSQTGPILGGPSGQPPTVNVPPTIYPQPWTPGVNGPFTGPETLPPTPQLPPAQLQRLPAAPTTPPKSPTAGLPEGQLPKQLGPGVYEAGEGELYDTIRQESIRPPEGKVKPPSKPADKLKVSEQRPVRPKEGELDVKKITEEGREALKVTDKRSELEQPKKFSTVPDRLQDQPSRQEVVDKVSNRNKFAQAPEKSAAEFDNLTARLKKSFEKKKKERLTTGEAASTKDATISDAQNLRFHGSDKAADFVETMDKTASPKTRVPKENVWEAKDIGGNRVEVYKNGTKMFDESMPAAEAQKWINKRKSEEKGVRKLYTEGEKGSVPIGEGPPKSIKLEDGTELTFRSTDDWGESIGKMHSYDVTKSPNLPSYEGSTLNVKLGENPQEVLQRKVTQTHEELAKSKKKPD